MGDDRKSPSKDSGKEWWYRIAGRVSSYKTVKSQYGDTVCLIGEFQAQRFDTGEVFVSGKAYLPAGVAELVSGKLAAAQDDNDEQTADILLDIGATYSEKSPRGYEWCVRSPTNDLNDSPVRKLLGSVPLPTNMRRLPSPEDGKK